MSLKESHFFLQLAVDVHNNIAISRVRWPVIVLGMAFGIEIVILTDISIKPHLVLMIA